MKIYAILSVLFVFTSFMITETNASENLASENLLFNSSFELGKNGWESFRETLVRNNDYTSIEPGFGIDDKTAYAGNNSIFMTNEGNKSPRRVSIDSHDFIVKPDQKYTVSFWAKSSMPNTTLISYVFSNQRMLRRDNDGNILPDVDWGHCSYDEETRSKPLHLKISDQWQRYSYTFVPQKYFTAYVLRFSVAAFKAETDTLEQRTARVNIDCVQVQAGDLTDYMPKANIEAAVDTSDYLYENSNQVKGAVKVISYNNDEIFEFPLFLYDTYFEKQLQEQRIGFNMKMGEVATQPFTFNNLPKGMFCIYTGLQPRTTPSGFHAEWDRQPECLSYQRLLYDDESYQSSAFFAAVDTNDQKTETGFRIGTNGPLDNYLAWRGTNEFGSDQEQQRVIRLSGGNVLRCWDPTICMWSRIEPEKSKFNWEGTDKRIESAEKMGIDVMCVIGGDFIVSRTFVPDWVKTKDRSGNPKGTKSAKKLWGGKEAYYFQPPLEDWCSYVSNVATRYKGRIKFYEMMNESDLYMPVEVYMEYMKAAAEEVRKADPDAVILGICSTADKSVDPDAETITCLGKCLDLGADDYMDSLTIHPYAMLDNSRPVSQQQARRDHLAFLKKKSAKARLWNGENYWVVPEWMPATNLQLRWEPENLTRHLLVDMGENLSGSTPTNLALSLLSIPIHPHINQVLSAGTTRRYPNANFAAHAACAKFLAGAEPLHTLELKCEAMGYLFKNGNRLLSAIWNSRSEQKTEIKLDIPQGAILTVYDVMGNMMRKDTSEVKLPLSPRPYYMEWAGTTAEVVIDRFNHSTVTGENPIKIEGARILKNENASVLKLVIKNTSGVDIKDSIIGVASDDFQPSVNIAVDSFGDSLTTEWNVPVVLSNPDILKTNVFVTPGFGNKKSLETTAHIKNVTIINGVAKTFKISKCVDGIIDDDQDLSAEFSIKYDDNRMLVLDVDVKDGTRGSDAKEDYNQDCIELFVDMKPFSDEKRSYTQILIPVKSGRFQMEDMTGNITITDDGYNARIYYCARDPKYMGFDIAIDDSDSNKRETQIVWKGTKYNYKSNEGWALLELAPANVPNVKIE